jgi:hypothetical protein
MRILDLAAIPSIVWKSGFPLLVFPTIVLWKSVPQGVAQFPLYGERFSPNH